MSLKLEYKSKIVAILRALFPDAKIYLFGSRAQGTHRKTSDIDVAVDVGKQILRRDIGEARDMLRESNIPYKVDVVDLHGIPEKMKSIILEEGILWKD